MNNSQDEIEQIEADKLFKQMASYNCPHKWLLYEISETRYKFNEQNYLNIAYGLDHSRMAVFNYPVEDVDIMELFNRNIFRNIIFEYLDNVFGEYNRQFIDIIVSPISHQYIIIDVPNEESKNQIERSLRRILPDHEDYIKIHII